MPPTRVPMPAIRPGGRPGGYSGPPRLPDPSQLRDRSYEDIGRLVGTLGGSGRGEFPLGTAGPRVDPSDPNYIPESPREDLIVFDPFGDGGVFSDQDMTGRGTAPPIQLRPDISLPTGFRGGQMGGPMDNMGLMRRQQDMLRQMQNRGGFQTLGPESLMRQQQQLGQQLGRLRGQPVDQGTDLRAQARLQQIDARPPIARLQQQQQGDRSMPRAITGREQLMRRRSPAYQGPNDLIGLLPFRPM